MTSAPSTALLTCPRPPKRLVPPITAEAIAYIRSGSPPTPGTAELLREADITPPNAAIMPAIMKTMSLIRGTLMPARRAAPAVPPTADHTPQDATPELTH